MGDLLTVRADRLLSDFGAGKAVPGSGSAAALMGKLAANLARTACIKSKEHDRSSASRFDHLIAELDRSSAKLGELFEQDSLVFQDVVTIRIERDKTADRAQHSKLSRTANDKLEETSGIIAEIGQECLKVAEAAVSIFKEGWPHVRGDSGAAINSALAGAMSCVFITGVNSRTLRKRESVSARLKSDGRALSAKIERIQKQTWDCVAELYSEDKSGE